MTRSLSYQNRSARHVHQAEHEIAQLERKGWKIERFNEYHYRIQGQFDIYPVNHRFHDVKTGKRGFYSWENLTTILSDRGIKNERPSLFARIFRFVYGRR